MVSRIYLKIQYSQQANFIEDSLNSPDTLSRTFCCKLISDKFDHMILIGQKEVETNFHNVSL